MPLTLRSRSSGRGEEAAAVRAWALYDWGNSAFATAVVAGLYPVMLKGWWGAELESTRTTFLLGLVSAAVALGVAVLAPLLGAVADGLGRRRAFLGAFAFLGAAATAGLALAGEGAWRTALALYGIAALGFGAANAFYDALLTQVASPRDYDRVSAYGYALGYLGGGLFFAAAMGVVLGHESLGLDSRAQAVQGVLVATALWWAAFTVPVLRRVRESQAAEPGLHGVRAALGAGWRRLRETFHHVRRLKPVAWFLAAYWLYIDGVNTVFRMAVDYGAALGLGTGHLLGALLLTQFVSFPAALAFGRIGERWGSRAGIWLGLAVYGAVTAWGYFLVAAWQFYVLALAVGLVQGGVQSLSRAWYARLVPPEAAAEFFGFYNVVGRFAAVLGPLAVGLTAELAGSHRLALLALLAFFGLGGLLLARVPDPARPGLRRSPAPPP